MSVVRKNNQKIKRHHSTPLVKQPIFSADVEYQLKFFDPKNIRDFSTILFAGGRRTGKSFCMRDVIYFLRKRIYDCYVYSGTRDEDHPWEQYVPEKYIQYVSAEFPNEHLQVVLDKQKIRKQIAENHKLKCPPSMVLFEDLEFLVKPMWKTQSIREVCLNGRWDKVFAVAAVQYIMKIDMSVRSMFDYAFFMLEPNRSVRERIYKQYCGIFPTYHDFETVFLRCTEDHMCLVVDLRPTSNKVEDSVFWYKASDRGRYHLGVPEVWDENVDRKNKSLANQAQATQEPANVASLVDRQERQQMKRGKKSAPGSISVKLKK